MSTEMQYAWLKGPQDLTVESKTLSTTLGPHDVWSASQPLHPTPPHPIWRRLPNPSGSWPRRAHTIVSALKIGTDRGNFQGPEEGADHFPGAPEYPRYVGDSNCALIKAVGSEVKHFKVGERIVTRWPHQSDYVFNELTGDGVEDRDDQNNFGGLDGMLKVPDGVSAEDAVWAWLWTLSQACYQKSLFKPGETVRAATAPCLIPPPCLIPLASYPPSFSSHPLPPLAAAHRCALVRGCRWRWLGSARSAWAASRSAR